MKQAPTQPLDGFTFEGYRNADGTVGTRNILAITTTVQCVAGVVDYALQRIRTELLPRYPNVDDVVALDHTYGCGVAIDAPDAIVPIRTLRNISLNPNFAFARASNGKTDSWTPYVGYSLAYQVRPSLDFNSGLTNIWVLGNTANTVQRTTLMYFGFTKRFSAMPGALIPTRHAGRLIEGRVFRNNNVNGTFNFGEQGLVGLRVRLDDGEVTETDEQGRYKFADVSQGEIHYFIAGGMRGSGAGSASQIASWVSQSFASTTVDGVTVYDLTQPAS